MLANPHHIRRDQLKVPFHFFLLSKCYINEEVICCIADIEPLQTNLDLEEGYCKAVLCRLRFRKVLPCVLLHNTYLISLSHGCNHVIYTIIYKYYISSITNLQLAGFINSVFTGFSIFTMFWHV